MAEVYYCSKTNSTCFTRCCEVAICDNQDACPACGEEVPYSRRERHEQGMRSIYTSSQLSEMRKSWRKRAGEG